MQYKQLHLAFQTCNFKPTIKKKYIFNKKLLVSIKAFLLFE